MSAQVRMADALLRTVGGRTVLLRISAPAVAGDLGEQIGLATPGFSDVALGPVVFRKVRPKAETGQAVQYELLVSATAVSKAVGVLGFDSAGVLFGQAAGVVVDGSLLRITTATSVEGFGSVYLYRLGLTGAAGTI